MVRRQHQTYFNRPSSAIEEFIEEYTLLVQRIEDRLLETSSNELGAYGSMMGRQLDVCAALHQRLRQAFVELEARERQEREHQARLREIQLRAEAEELRLEELRAARARAAIQNRMTSNQTPANPIQVQIHTRQWREPRQIVNQDAVQDMFHDMRMD